MEHWGSGTPQPANKFKMAERRMTFQETQYLLDVALHCSVLVFPLQKRNFLLRNIALVYLLTYKVLNLNVRYDISTWVLFRRIISINSCKTAIKTFCCINRILICVCLHLLKYFFPKHSVVCNCQIFYPIDSSNLFKMINSASNNMH